MRQSKAIGWSLVAWLVVAIFWLFTTRSHHPTWTLAVIVTASLIIASACATFVNHLLLVPRFMKSSRYGRYFLSILATIAISTGVALTVIRLSYYTLHGPDPDPNGVYVHYAIDFSGITVHVLCAAAIVWIYGQFTKPRERYISK